ncbi:unannotated protein [freshwater metagenome]|jgi:hypothetical protein|uniref:Unannotated protein n=1 Tax=freshwater metagenome TaxID=449393 RepID=A0A6J7G380_9ZZZZ|nr:hypothetical protein [Actinomycetota bacterium]
MNGNNLTLLSNRTQIVEFKCNLNEEQVREIDNYISLTPNIYNDLVFDKLKEMGVVFEVDTEWNETEDFFGDENPELKEVIHRLQSPLRINNFKFLSRDNSLDNEVE